MPVSNPCGVAHFKNQPCRLCDRILAEREKSGRKGKLQSTDVAPADLGSRDSPALSNALFVGSPGNVKTATGLRIPLVPADTSTSDGLITNRESCRRWRTTGDVEGKREANRLRMRRKRLK